MQRTLAGLALAGSWLLASAAHVAQDERSPGVKRLVIVLEVDSMRVRQLDWMSDDTADGPIVELVAKLLQRRFEAMGRAVQWTIAPEANRIELALPQVDPRDPELFQGLFRSIGICELLLVAEDDSAVELDVDLARERQRLEAWRAANPTLPLAAFNALAPAQQGPSRRLYWIEPNFTGAPRQPPVALILPDKAEDSFGAATFARVHATQDAFGYPAIGFELERARVGDFERFTTTYQGRRLGVVLAPDLVSSITLSPNQTGAGLIEGRLSASEISTGVELCQRLQGPLRVVEMR